MTLSRGAAVLLGLLALPALAEEKVELIAEVVLASTAGDIIEPESLAAMKAKFAEKFKYTSFRRLSHQKLAISIHPTELALPGKKVTLRLEELKEGVAKLKVVAPPMSTTYTLGREGSLYIASGKHAGGDLWLVLSPVTAR